MSIAFFLYKWKFFIASLIWSQCSNEIRFTKKGEDKKNGSDNKLS